MSGAVIALIVVGGVLLLILLWGVGIYNGLVRLRNEVKNAWAQIDVQLKRRHDLIPNLVETVKGYAAHEKGTLDAVISARAKALGAQSINDKVKAEGELSGVLSRLLMLQEAYPQLKANENFLALQEELSSTENKIGFSRQYYNDAVMRYNNQIQSFPPNIVAGMFAFTESVFFEVQDAAQREAPQVKF
jgi:LemA protein